MNKIKLDSSFVKQLAENSNSIGAFIGSLTALNGFTRAEFVNLMGISLSYASQLLCDRVPWTKELVLKAAELFGVNEYIFTLVDPDILSEPVPVVPTEELKPAEPVVVKKEAAEKPDTTEKKEKKEYGDVDVTSFSPVSFDELGLKRLQDCYFSLNVNTGKITFSSNFDLKDYNYASILQNKDGVCAFCFTKKTTSDSFRLAHDKYGYGRMNCKSITNFLKNKFVLEDKGRLCLGPNIAKNKEAVIRVVYKDN